MKKNTGENKNGKQFIVEYVRCSETKKNKKSVQKQIFASPRRRDNAIGLVRANGRGHGVDNTR